VPLRRSLHRPRSPPGGARALVTPSFRRLDHEPDRSSWIGADE
jgi:hypothetical protein